MKIFLLLIVFSSFALAQCPSVTDGVYTCRSESLDVPLELRVQAGTKNNRPALLIFTDSPGEPSALFCENKIYDITTCDAQMRLTELHSCEKEMKNAEILSHVENQMTDSSLQSVQRLTIRHLNSTEALASVRTQVRMKDITPKEFKFRLFIEKVTGRVDVDATCTLQ